jgi:hypothetical protein
MFANLVDTLVDRATAAEEFLVDGVLRGDFRGGLGLETLDLACFDLEDFLPILFEEDRVRVGCFGGKEGACERESRTFFLVEFIFGLKEEISRNRISSELSASRARGSETKRDWGRRETKRRARFLICLGKSSNLGVLFGVDVLDIIRLCLASLPKLA